MPLISEMVHPRSLDFANQRQVILLRDVKQLEWGQIRLQVKNLQGERPSRHLCMRIYKEFSKQQGHRVFKYAKCDQSATNMFAYVQYLFGVAVVATIDLDAPDSHLVNPGHAQASNWLPKNCVIVRLPAGDAFFDRSAMPDAIVENTFSRFAETVKRRRLAK